MQDQEFINQVYPEFIFRQELNNELVKMAGQPALQGLGNSRLENDKSYIGELKSHTQNADWNQPFYPSSAQMQQLISLRNLDPVAYKSRLIMLLMENEETLIGIHVKASTSTGLINGNLRSWAESKLTYFRGSLSEVQQYKGI